jgi:hypothetical protein
MKICTAVMLVTNKEEEREGICDEEAINFVPFVSDGLRL